MSDFIRPATLGALATLMRRSPRQRFKNILRDSALTFGIAATAFGSLGSWPPEPAGAPAARTRSYNARWGKSWRRSGAGQAEERSEPPLPEDSAKRRAAGFKGGTLPHRCCMIARDSFLALRQGVEGARGAQSQLKLSFSRATRASNGRDQPAKGGRVL